ncbi:Hypothetical protein, putative [Bodo saltans]|uniref:Uncharacterized protein n=2 Tax=Bodo saltans TaxID=75058 RepID=A0A0S4JMP1_BODSA|nr:Hypothetical protein, putative [Bodo saltans]|eukprot:CUG91919.1 Hypothetical protein, putative [Bodo saltans]
MPRRDRVTALCELVIDDNLQVMLVESHEDHLVRLVFDFTDCLKRFDLRFICCEENGKATVEALPSSSTVLCHFTPRSGAGDLSAELTYSVSASVEGERPGDFVPADELLEGSTISSITVTVDRYPQLLLEITDIKGGGHGFLLHAASPVSPRDHAAATKMHSLDGRWVVLSLKGSSNIEWTEVEPYAEEFEDISQDDKDATGAAGCGALCVPADKLLRPEADEDGDVHEGPLKLGSVRLIDPRIPTQLCYRVWAIDRPKATTHHVVVAAAPAALVSREDNNAAGAINGIPSPTGLTNSSDITGWSAVEPVPTSTRLETEEGDAPVVDELTAVAPHDYEDIKEIEPAPSTPPLSPSSSSSSASSEDAAPAGSGAALLQDVTLAESEVRHAIMQHRDDQWRSDIIAAYIQATCALCLQPVSQELRPPASPLVGLVVHPDCAARAPRCTGCGKMIVGKYLVRVHKSSTKPDEPYHVDCKWLRNKTHSVE